MSLSLEHLAQEIEDLKIRNVRVEAEKSWEISWQRRLSIIVITYLVMLILLWSLGNPSPFLSVIIPTLGYILSILSMEWMERLFLKK